MILTQGQEAALRMVANIKAFNGRRPHVAVLAGFAGTGKSFLLSKIPEVLGGVPTVITPTGKSALRVRELTGIQARTIHSFAFNAKENPMTGEVVYTRKALADLQESRGETDLLVVDEASMVDESLWMDVFDVATVLRMNILLIGDGFQLPPVKQDPNGPEFNLLSKDFNYDSRVDLTEVVRQARSNPIIAASMLIREGDPSKAILHLPRIPNSQLLEYASSILRGDGVVIVHQNKTRHLLNEAIRLAMGKPDGQLVAGEPLLILQNSYRTNRVNGEIARFGAWLEEPRSEHVIKDWIKKGEHKSKFGIAQIEKTEYDQKGVCALAVAEVFGKLSGVSLPPIVRMSRVLCGGGQLTVEEAEKMSTEEINDRLGPPHLHCNLAYAISCHKFQGSEAKDVLVVIEPSVRLGTEDGRRWLYTAATRSRETLKICIGAGPAGRINGPPTP